MKRLLLSAAVTCLVVSPLACDFGRTGSQFLAQKVMVGTLFSTPDVNVSILALAGADAGTLPDGGIPENERLTIPGQTASLVYFATRPSDSTPPEPLSNATVRIDVKNGSSVSLENKGLGTYSLTSGYEEDSGVKYRPGTDYRFVAVQGGETHVGLVEAAPAQERIETIHPASGYVRHTMNQSLTLRRPAISAGLERTLGFVTVVPLNSKGDKGQPTYTNLPADPITLLQIVLAPVDYQRETLDIPGSAFPNPNSSYLVIFQTVKTGGPESENLFIGSALMVGTADIGLVRTQ